MEVCTQVNTEVKIVDFAASPNKVTYILAAGGKGYFVQNRDSNRTDLEGNYKERNVILGRLTDGEWKAGKSGIPVHENFGIIGLPFEGLMYSGPHNIFGLKGDLRKDENQKGYYTKDYHTEFEEPTKITSSEMSKLFDDTYLQYLEHFMVPESMANKIREKPTVAPATFEQLSSPSLANYGKIKIENLMKRPDRMVYMLVDTSDQTNPEQQPTFIIENNDTDMVRSWPLYHNNWKTEIGHRKTRRHITVARLIDKEDEKNMDLCPALTGPGGALFKGFAFPTSLFGKDGGDWLTKKIIEEIGETKFLKEYPELYSTAGRISSDYCYDYESENNTKYTTANQMPIDEDPSEIAKLFTPPLLQQLERFTVPHVMAAKIREYFKELKQNS